VFVEGLTLAGARRRLEEEPRSPSVPAVTVDDALGDMARSRLRQVRTGLEAIMQLLSRDAGRASPLELQLVPPSPLGVRARAGSPKSPTPVTRRPSKTVAKSSAGKRRRAS
jgi:hypothetical protein